MGRMYAATFEGVTVSAIQDLFEITPADDKPIAISGVFLSQSSDKGDAAEDLLRIKIIRGHTTGGSGGSTPTPQPLNPADTAAGAVVEANNTTIASAGSAVDLHAEAFNIRSGWVYLPPPEQRPRCSQGQTTIVVRLVAAPAVGDNTVTMSGTLIFEELA